MATAVCLLNFVRPSFPRTTRARTMPLHADRAYRRRPRSHVCCALLCYAGPVSLTGHVCHTTCTTLSAKLHKTAILFRSGNVSPRGIAPQSQRNDNPTPVVSPGLKGGDAMRLKRDISSPAYRQRLLQRRQEMFSKYVGHLSQTPSCPKRTEEENCRRGLPMGRPAEGYSSRDKFSRNESKTRRGDNNKSGER